MLKPFMQSDEIEDVRNMLYQLLAVEGLSSEETDLLVERAVESLLDEDEIYEPVELPQYEVRCQIH